MKKEIVIIIGIVVVIIVLHAGTQIYTNNYFDNIKEDLDIMENKILQNNYNKEELQNDINNINDRLKKKYDLFAIYIEHDELEKVQTQLISIDADIKVENYDRAVDEIEKCKFILTHIENKDSFKIINIF